MREAGQIEVEPVSLETTAERIERENLETKAAHELARARDIEAQAQKHNQEAGKVNHANAVVASHHADERDLKAEVIGLQQRLRTLNNQRADLRSQIETESELKQLNEEIEGLVNGIAQRPFAEAHPSKIDQLNRLRTLASLWPTRKVYLQSQLVNVEASIKAGEVELSTKLSLFEKVKRSLAKMLPKSED